MLNTRHAAQGQRAENRRIDRHFAPAQTGQPLITQGVGKSLFGSGAGSLVGTHEHHAHGVLVGQFDRQRLAGNLAQKTVRLLNEQAATIAGLAVGVNAAAVGHARQRFNCRLQQVMTGLAFHVGNQTKATVILELIRLV